MIKLDLRLQAVLDLVKGVDTLADIGCDHGKLIVKAIAEGNAKSGIAVDISCDSLNKAKALAKELGVYDKIKFYCGDGLLPIDNKIDCALIAGMGGREIAKILAQKDIANKYILVPHQDAEILREYLRGNRFFVEKDFVVQEQKFYQIIETRKGENNYTQSEIYLGKNLPQSQDYDKRLAERYQTVLAIMEKREKFSSAVINGDTLNAEWEELKKWRS